MNIDIRETVNYKKVMKQYQLGPNGAIMTSLNLYSTRFDQVLELLEKRAPSVDIFLFDTPGQIEVFTWSASGQLITEALSASFPTSIVYVMDSVRCQQPVSFMSNMMYACSVMYKAALPFIVTFNKCDAAPAEKQLEWMRDAEEFMQAADDVGSYVACLSRSSALVLEEFYKNLPVACVSSSTGEGFKKFFEIVDSSVDTFHNEFVPWKKSIFEKRQAEEQATLTKGLELMSIDRSKDRGLIQPSSGRGLKEVKEVDDEEDEE